MNAKLFLFLALVLSGALLLGCSPVEYRPASSDSATPELYLHFLALYLYPRQPRLILSSPVQVSKDFDIPMTDDQHFKGRIERRDGKYFVYFRIHLCDGTNVFDGDVQLDKWYDPWPEPYDNKVPFVFQPAFVLSANSNADIFLKQVAAAAKRGWQLKNPLTARQLAEVERKFHLLRPGMTQDEVFVMLGLSGDQNRLRPSDPFLTRLDIGDYELTEGERLMLFFDNTGMKTKNYQLADGESLRMLDYASDLSLRLVIRAQLDKVVQFSNAPPVWRTALQWP